MGRKITIGVALDEDIYLALLRKKENEGVPMSWVINKAVRAYLTGKCGEGI